MKVLVIGASGIIGQHLQISVPEGVEAIFTTRKGSPIHEAFELREGEGFEERLNEWKPDAIVNLAGQNSPDVVERESHYFVNRNVPVQLEFWCRESGAHLIHVSSQAALDPVNRYGLQKHAAELTLQNHSPGNWTIIRPTFVLGIRPFPGIGRENPAERILSGKETHSVDNRYFAVSFAWDVADAIWKAVKDGPRREIINVGHPERFSRYSLAKRLGADLEPVTQEWAQKEWGIAPRPMDTSEPYMACDERTGFSELLIKWIMRDRTDEQIDPVIAAFLQLDGAHVEEKLLQGFGPLHNAVTEDFRRANPQSEAELLDWYRTTEAYIWELAAYHCDPGFNYAGTCKGIIDALITKGCKRVLCLGDGIGTLTIKMKETGLEPVYHDLAGSRTAAFAAARFFMRFGQPPLLDQTLTFSPVGMREQPFGMLYDAVVSLDFLEHVPNVREWVEEISAMLKPGGYFIAQNAFGMGSGPDGAMPMHLSCNDRFEKDWDPLLESIGFIQEASNWYRKS